MRRPPTTVLALLVLGGLTPRLAAQTEYLNGSGSTFAMPMIHKWSKEYYSLTDEKVRVAYIGNGSGAGLAQLVSRPDGVHFALVETPLRSADRASAAEVNGEVLQLPLLVGGVVPIYNLGKGMGKEPVRFTGPILADIYLGKIKNWDDKRLQEINDGKLPSLPIHVGFRKGKSGSTYVWTEYLSKAAPGSWDRGVTTALIMLPNGHAESGTGDLASWVKKTDGAVGYVELAYALDNGLAHGAVLNQQKEFVQGSPESIKAALVSSVQSNQVPTDLALSLTDSPGKGAYPICSVTWAILYKRQPGKAGTRLKAFLKWVVNEGQQYTPSLHYVPLPDALAQRVNQAIDTIEVGN